MTAPLVEATATADETNFGEQHCVDIWMEESQSDSGLVWTGAVRRGTERWRFV